MSRASSTRKEGRKRPAGPIADRQAGPIALPVATVVLAALSVGLTGCGDDSARPGARNAESNGSEDGVAAVTPAVYRTTLAFLGFGAPPVRLFLHLENRTSEKALELEYGGWLWEGGSWRSVLDVSESAGVPRAAWRVLPVGPLRLSVTDGEELAGLAFDEVEGGLGLRLGEDLAEWASVTGQRESLTRAVIELGGGEQGGILLTSQTARVAGAASRGGERATMLTDTLGNALVILRSGRGADAPVVVHTVFGENSRRWDGAELTVAPDSVERGGAGAADESAAALDSIIAEAVGDGAFERYGLALPGAEIRATLAIQGPDSAHVGDVGTGLPAAFAAVRLPDGRLLSMSGYQVALGAPREDRAEP